MNNHDLFFKSIGVKKSTDLKSFSKKLGISLNDLRYYNDNNILPSDEVLETIEKILGISGIEIMLKMGIFNPETRRLIAEKN